MSPQKPELSKESISFLAHELRNPLAATQLYVEMMLKGVAGNLTKKQKEMLEEILRSNEKMTQIINDFKAMYT